QVNVAGTRLARTVLPYPRQDKKLSIRRPCRRNRVALVGHALLIRAIGFHSVNLRQTRLPADEGQLRPSLAIPHRRNIWSLAGSHPVQVPPRNVGYVNFRSTATR